MNQSRSLEHNLAYLLKYGTLICWLVIGAGVLLKAADIATPGFDLVSIGIVGFILLPILRLVCMLIAYLRTKDRAMIRVVTIVLCLVLTGLVAGNLM